MNLRSSSSHCRSARPAFTLVEMLLYLSMTGILIVSVSMTYYVGYRSRIKSQTVLDVDAAGRQALEMVTSAIRNANAVNDPVLGATQASLSLAVPDPLKNPTVVALSAGAITIQEGAASALAITPPHVTVSGLTVDNFGRPGTKGLLRVRFSVSRTGTSGRNEFQYTKDFSASVSLR